MIQTQRLSSPSAPLCTISRIFWNFGFVRWLYMMPKTLPDFAAASFISSTCFV